MNALVGMGVSVVGDIVGGRDRQKKTNKVAKRLKELRDRDQAEALRLAREDEARLVAQHEKSGGYNLAKLRDEATAAGFNPLTVLQATGAAGYANTAPGIISSPFISRVDSVKEAQLAKIDAAGYVGDAISRAGSAYIGISESAADRAAQRDLANAIRSPVQTEGAFPQGATQIDARPSAPLPGVPGAAYVLGREGEVVGPLTVGATDSRGRVVPVPSEFAPDIETQLTGALNEGVVGWQVRDWWYKNTMQPRDYDLWVLTDRARRAIREAEPTFGEKVRAGEMVWNPFGSVEIGVVPR